MIQGRQERTVQTDVIGSGGAGLTAALPAALDGASAVVREPSAQLGGTTAISGDGMWIARNPFMAQMGIDDHRDDALGYATRDAQGRSSTEPLEAFVDEAPLIHHSPWCAAVDGPAQADPPWRHTEQEEAGWGASKEGQARLWELALQRTRDRIVGRDRALVASLAAACARDGLKNAGVCVARTEHATIESIYWKDPNRLQLEMTARKRPLTDREARDTVLGVDAPIRTVEQDPQAAIEDMWTLKAQLVEPEGPGDSPGLYVLDGEEFAPLFEAARNAENTKIREVRDLLAIDGSSEPRIRREDTGLIEAIGSGAPTDGLRGDLRRFDEEELVVAAG